MDLASPGAPIIWAVGITGSHEEVVIAVAIYVSAGY